MNSLRDLIPDSMLTAIAVVLAREGYIVAKGSDVRGNICRIADSSAVSPSGNGWRYPKGYALKTAFYPAYHAEYDALHPAGKAPGKARKVAAAGKNPRFVKGSPEAKAYMASIRSKRSGKGSPIAATAVSESGKLSAAERDILLSLFTKLLAS